MSESAEDINKTVAEGSTLYYALLYVNEQAAQQTKDTLQFADAISSALHDVSEPTVAEKKIHWWHEELARLAKQEARHPACVAVQPYLHSTLDVRAALSILSTTSNERYTPFATDQALTTSVQEEYEERLRLIDSALNSSSSVKTRTAIALGLGHFNRVYSLVKMLRSGYAVFSNERYKQYDLTPDLLLAYSNDAKSDAPSGTTQAARDNDVQKNDVQINAFLEQAITEASDALATAIASIENSKELGIIALPIQIICRIRYAQTLLWKKQKPDLLKESLSLTPLKKFFIAYRCKRAFFKNRVKGSE